MLIWDAHFFTSFLCNSCNFQYFILGLPTLVLGPSYTREIVSERWLHLCQKYSRSLADNSGEFSETVPTLYPTNACVQVETKSMKQSFFASIHTTCSENIFDRFMEKAKHTYNVER